MSNPSNNQPVTLVTGGAGYIGSQLIRDLATDPRFAGHIIRVYDNLQRRHYCGLMDLPPEGRYEFIEGDVLDRLNLARAMHGVGLVMHMAALVSTPLSFDHPEWTEQVNHWGTATVVEQALQAGVSRFLYVSSSSVYGSGGPFRETDPCRPIGPYAISKLRGEKEALRAPFTIVRLGTVFGSAPAMRYDGIANRLAYLAGVRRPLAVHGSGTEIRPLIHVHDASAALRMCLTEPRAAGEIVNAVTLNPTALEIAQTLQALAPAAQIRYTDQDVLTEISFQVDAAKLFGWGFRPEIDLQQGLQEVLARWHSFGPPADKYPLLLDAS